MGKKKPETTIEENKSDVIDLNEITPEQLLSLSGGMQTIMSIGLAEQLYLEDLRDRLFYIDCEVTEELLHTVTMQIYKINGIDFGKPLEERVPIVLIVNSRGGSVEDGIGLMDAIRQSKTPVIGVCTGYAMSMAFCIYSVCHTRLAMPNSIYMFHDGVSGIMNTTTKVNDWALFSPKVDNRINRMIAENSKFTVEYLEKIAPHDNYWFADEMVEKGIVDGIIGKDIEMGEIFAFMSDDFDDECEDDCKKCSKK